MVVALLTTDNRECFREYGKPAPYFGQPLEALFQAVPSHPELQMHIISCWQKPMPAPAKLAPNLWFHGLVVPKLGWLRTGYQGCIRAARRKLREIRPDVVHGQGTERDCALEAVHSGFPNVLTIHGNMRSTARRLRARPFTFPWLAARLEAYALPRTGGVFCNSAYTEREVRPIARQTWRVPNPLQMEFLSVPTPSRSAAERPRLLCIGNVLPYKRQVEILNLATRLHERGLQFEIDFIGRVGADPYSTEFKRRLREAEARGFARHLGFLETGELIRRMDESCGLIHFPTEEAFGLVVMESLARNLKVFGVRAGGVVDVADGVEGAQLFDEHDWAGLAESISQWLATGCPCPTTASAEMAKRYHPEVVTRKHIEIYREVVSNRS